MAESSPSTRRFQRYPSMIRSLSTDESMVREQSLYDRHCKHLVGRLGRLRENGEHTDITLVAGTSKIKAHRVILAALSPYFEALLRPDSWEPPQEEVKLRDLNGATVEKLVDFAYTGKINYTDSTVQDVLETANFLDVEVVRHDCAKYIAQQLDALNFSDIYSLGRQIGEEIMYMSAIDYVSANISMISKTAEFLQMPVDMLQDLLKSEYVQYYESGLYPIPANQEHGLLRAVLTFVDHDREVRGPMLQDLLRLVRLPVLLPSVLSSLRENPVVASQPGCMQLIERVISKDYSTNDRTARPRENKLLDAQWSRPFADSYQLGADLRDYDDTQTVPHGAHVCGMRIYERRWDGRPVWGGYEVFYSNGTSLHHGGKDFGCSIYEFLLDAGEVITRITLNSGWLIDQLTFHTSQGRTFGPYGGSGGGRHEVTYQSQSPLSTMAYLGATRGQTVTTQDQLAIKGLQFYWVYCQPKGDDDDGRHGSDVDSGEELCE